MLLQTLIILMIPQTHLHQVTHKVPLLVQAVLRVLLKPVQIILRPKKHLNQFKARKIINVHKLSSLILYIRKSIL